MKLKSGFITQMIDDTQFLVPVGGEAFSGIARSNGTAAFIVDCLQEDTTEEKITDALCARYDVDRAVAEADVSEIIAKLRGIHALEE